MSFQVFQSLDEVRAHAAPAAITIGNFDGVHRGHQLLFDRTQAAARAITA